MPKINIDAKKGLFSSTGAGIKSKPITQALTANAPDNVIDSSKGFYIKLTSTEPLTVNAGKAVTIKDGTELGQLLLLENANAADAIEVEANHLAVTINGGATFPAGELTLLVWNATKWSPTSQSVLAP